MTSRHSSLLIGLMAVILTSAVALAANPASLITALDRLRTTNTQILGTAVVTMDKDGFVSGASVASGFRDQTKLIGMQLDTPVSAGNFGELLLGVATVQLIQDSILPQLDETIPARLLPRGLTFANPNFQTAPLTLRMLLTHTSSLRDDIRWRQTVVERDAGTVTDLRTFCESYFISTSGTSFSLAPDIFSPTAEPGLAASYIFAESNIALLSFVVQQIIGERPSLVSGQQKTVGAYIQETILNALGMTQTYFLLPDGSNPLVQLNLNNLGSNAAARATTQRLHPAYLTNHMLYTSALDMARLFSALFSSSPGTTYRTYSNLMIATMVTIPEAQRTSRPGVVQQGLAVQSFSVTELCAAWASVNAAPLTATCPYTVDRPVYGYVSVTTTSAIGVYCTLNPVPTANGLTNQPLTDRRCSAVAVAQSSANLNPITTRMTAAAPAEALMESYATSSDVTGASASVIRPEDQTRSGDYGFVIFGGLCALLFTIFMLTYLSEFFVRPAPLAGSVVVDAYPRMEIDDDLDSEFDDDGIF